MLPLSTIPSVLRAFVVSRLVRRVPSAGATGARGSGGIEWRPLSGDRAGRCIGCRPPGGVADERQPMAGVGPHSTPLSGLHRAHGGAHSVRGGGRWMAVARVDRDGWGRRIGLGGVHSSGGRDPRRHSTMVTSRCCGTRRWTVRFPLDPDRASRRSPAGGEGRSRGPWRYEKPWSGAGTSTMPAAPMSGTADGAAVRLMPSSAPSAPAEWDAFRWRWPGATREW